MSAHPKQHFALDKRTIRVSAIPRGPLAASIAPIGVEGPLAGAAVDADMTEKGAAVAEVEADAAREEGREGKLRVDGNEVS